MNKNDDDGEENEIFVSVPAIFFSPAIFSFSPTSSIIWTFLQCSSVHSYLLVVWAYF